MKVESLAVVRADRNGQMFLGEFIVLATLATLSLALATGQAATGESGPTGKSPVVTLENVPGSTVPRVILSARAAERLGIATGKVGEESVVRKQMVSGLIIPPLEKQQESKPGSGGFGGFGKVGGTPAPQLVTATAPAAKTGNVGFASFARGPAPPSQQPLAAPAIAPAPGEVWVLVTLSPGEWERLAKDKPVRLMQLATRESSGKDLWAQPTGMAPIEDMKRSMLSTYYVVPGKDHGLAVHNRMRVELPLSGSDEKQKVVPYSAVYYDAKGTAWVYVNEKPLTFERQRIVVERVVGDLAVLSAGPSVGTSVVTVGAALLYGAEIFKK